MLRPPVRHYLGAGAAMVAMGVSLTLLLSELKGQVLACNITSGCEAVLSSRYSHLFGVPLGVFGIAGFAWMLGLFILAIQHKRLRPLLFMVTGAGAIIALGLVGLQAFVIRQFCQYCLLIEAMSLVALVCGWDKNVFANATRNQESRTKTRITPKQLISRDSS